MGNEIYRVIVADDELLIANNIAKNIEKAHPAFRVAGIARDGAEALKMAEATLAHVVFSDIKMPVMDGLALMEALGARRPEIKKVIISGYDDFPFVREALKNQAFDYLLKPVNREELKQTLEKLYMQLCCERGALTAAAPSPPEKIVETVKCFIRENYTRMIDFASLAGQYGFSGSYLTRIFHHSTGVTLQRYLIDYRILCAKQLLTDTELSIQEIGARVGYPDPFHFSKVFKQNAGVNPTQYRSQSSTENNG
jgi:two-component system, response regulator YesN